LLFRTGFLLSVGATAGLVVLTGPIADRLPGPVALRQALAVPIAAQVGVLPIVLTTFGNTPLVALPANLVAQPFAAPITMLGFLAAVASWLIGPWWPELAQWLLYPVVGLIGAVDATARVAAAVPMTVDAGTVIGLLAAVGGIVGWLAVRRPSGAVGERPLASGSNERRIHAEHLHQHHHR
jgi:competence protein ComEC